MRAGRLSLAAAGLAVAAIAFASLGAERADARCQLQFAPDLSGETGGSLELVCGLPDAPTGGVDDAAVKQAKKKKRKPPPSYASIAVNVTDLNNGDLSFSGVYSAGYAKKRAAVRSAVGNCQKRLTGACKSFAVARNGWAALVATLRQDGTLTAFGGTGRSYESAFQDAERRARAALGAPTPAEIQRVRAVFSRAKR